MGDDWNRGGRRVVGSAGGAGPHATPGAVAAAPYVERLADGTWRITPARPATRRRPRRVSSATIVHAAPAPQPATAEPRVNAPSAGAHADDGRKPDATGTAPKDHGRAAATVGTLTMKDGLLVGMFSADDESRMPDIPSLIMGDDVTF